MKFVEPIRDKDILSQILIWLKRRNMRDYLIFLIGINTGLRISDILKLKYEHLTKQYIYITEQKTGKLKEIPVNATLRNEIKGMDVENPKAFIFTGREKAGLKPITRQRVYQIIKEIEVEFGLKNLGTHTLRKTFGYHFYQKNKDVVTLMYIFNHSSADITLRYIGVNSSMVDDAYKSFNLS